MRDLTFIRWGNIRPSKQFGYGSDSYHAPPAKKGLYAFPNEFVEPFLLGGFEFREDRHEWVKIDNNLIPYHENYKEDPLLKDYLGEDKYWGEIDLLKDYAWLRKTKLPPHEQFGRKNLGDDYRWSTDRYLAKWKKPKKFNHYGNIWTHWKPKNDPILTVWNDWFLVEYPVFVKLLQKRYAQERALKKSKGYSCSGDDCEVFIEKIISKKV